MDKAVQTWFNKFYGDCLGATSPLWQVVTEEDEKRVLETYEHSFLKPITYIATGTDVVPEDRSVLNKAISILGSGPVTDWIYLLRYWVDNGFYTYTGDIAADYKRCVEKTKKGSFVTFVTLGRPCHDIAVHTVNREVIDNIPFELLFYPRNLKAHYKGRLLSDLCKKLPSRITEEELAFLSAAESRGFITEADLASEKVMWPYNKGESERLIQINALTPNRPPSEYLDLVKMLPQATLDQHKTQFLAVQDYAKTATVSETVRRFLGIIASSGDDLQAGNVATIELNDENVMDYLLEHYGLKVSNLGELQVSAAGTINAVAIDADLADSMEELLAAVNETGEVLAETFDQTIERYCSEENIDLGCTVAQLVDNIKNGTHPVPPSVNDTLSTMVVGGLNIATTVAELLDGETHVDADPVEGAMQLIESCEMFDENMIERIRHALVDGLVMPTQEELFTETLAKMHVPDDLLARLNIAAKTGSAFEAPTVEKTVEVPKPIDPSEVLADRGFVAGYHLLLKTREKLSVDQSDKTRTGYTHVLYSFLRLLMGDAKNDKASITRLLTGRRDKANAEGYPEVGQVIEQAIEIFNK